MRRHLRAAAFAIAAALSLSGRAHGPGGGLTRFAKVAGKAHAQADLSFARVDTISCLAVFAASTAFATQSRPSVPFRLP